MDEQPQQFPQCRTPTLDEIAAHGNRGHRWVDNNHIVCADGTELSVIAGGGTYSWPRPWMCTHAFDLGGHSIEPNLPPELISRLSLYVACVYPGPYHAVEVWVEGREHFEDCDVEHGPGTWSVAETRAFILSHGGEIDPAEAIDAWLEEPWVRQDALEQHAAPDTDVD